MRPCMVIEGEDFSHGWSVLPVWSAPEAELKAAYARRFEGLPGAAACSGGRYLYSGTRITGCRPVAEVDFLEAGEYCVWVRCRTYAGRDRGRFLLRVGEWTSTEFGGKGPSDDWVWVGDRLSVAAAGTRRIQLEDVSPEACCDVVMFTLDHSFRPVGPDGMRSCPPDTVYVPRRTFPDVCREGVRVHEIRHGRTASYHGYFGDLNGDGKDEVILAFEDEHLEAFDVHARSLWSCPVRFPWQSVNKENYRERGYRYFIPHDFRPNRADGSGYHIMDDGPVLDLDGDGALEFVFGWNPVYVIDARTGRIKHERMLPGQGARIAVADLSGTGVKREVVAVTKDAVDGCAYVHGLDARLNVLWQTRVTGPDIEHRIAVGDLNGDGRDEIAFTSFAPGPDAGHLNCLAHDGRLLWRLEERALWGGHETHTDQLMIDTLEDGRGPLLILCEGWAFDTNGSVAWKADPRLPEERAAGSFDRFDHGQNVGTAKLRPDLPGRQVFFGERNIGNVYCFDGSGRLLWKRGRFHGERVHVSDVRPINWRGGDRRAEVLCRSLGVLDGEGNLVKETPYAECGSSNLHAADMVGDERDEIVTTIGQTTYIIENRTPR